MIYVDPSGHIPVPLITALIGGLITTGVNFATDLIDDGSINKGYKSYLGSFAEGAIIGAGLGILGPSASLLAQTAMSFGTGVLGNSTNQLISTGNVNIKNAVITRSNNIYRNFNIWSR